MSITYDLPQRKYRSSLFPDSGWDSLGEAQAAERGPGNTTARYNATDQTYAPPPVAQTAQSSVQPSFDESGSLAALRSAGSSSSSTRTSSSGGGSAMRTTTAPVNFDPLASLSDVMTRVNTATASNKPATGMGPDESAARAAAFARAKDQAANIARASLSALRNAYAARGLNVAGGQNRMLSEREAGVADNAEGQLGEFTREQLIQDLNRARTIGDRDYNATVAHGTQNVGLAQSILSMMQAQSRGAY